MSVVVGHDAIHANISHLPPGQQAGYTTGTDGTNGTVDIRWRPADWKARPGAVRICQDSTASDHTADVLDVERFAATNAEAAGWFKAALGTYHSAKRPGQRSPAIYTSASNVTPLVNALIAGGVTSGVGLWVANWNLSLPQAYADVVNAAGPYPIVAVQWSSGATYDTDVFSGGWLARVSQATPGAPYRHLTRAGDTVAGLAAARSMKPDTWLAEQARLGADLSVLASGPLPPGTVWLSVNP
jgi:hypothetical protein